MNLDPWGSSPYVGQLIPIMFMISTFLVLMEDCFFARISRSIYIRLAMKASALLDNHP